MKTLKRSIPVLVCLILLTSCTQRIDYLKELPSIEVMEGMLYYKGTSFTGELFKNYENGQLHMERIYKDGKRVGLFKQYYENGQLHMEGYYKDGKQDGLYKQYFENGQLHMEKYYKDGIEDGLYKQYFENGQLSVEGNYKDEKEDGLIKKYYENGQLKLKRYDKPFEDGYIEYYEDGYMKVKEEWYSKDSIRYGIELKFNLKGDTIYWANKKNDKLEGQSKTILNKQGNYSIVNYKNGKRVGRRTMFKANGKKIKEGITPLSEASLNEVTSSLRKKFYGGKHYHTSTLEILKNSKFRMTYNYKKKNETPESIKRAVKKTTGFYVQESTTKYNLIIEGDYIIYKTNIWKWNNYGNVPTRDSRGNPTNEKRYYGYKIVFSGYDNYGKFHTMCGDISQKVIDNNQYQHKWELGFSDSADGSNCERGDSKNREATIPGGYLKEL